MSVSARLIANVIRKNVANVARIDINGFPLLSSQTCIEPEVEDTLAEANQDAP
jgi:hypothetical protein